MLREYLMTAQDVLEVSPVEIFLAWWLSEIARPHHGIWAK
nr:unnamed protein product [Callosobruchus analis]